MTEPDQKTQTIVNELADGSIIISFREYYADQWHSFEKICHKPLGYMSDDEKQELIGSATNWHTLRKAKIAEEMDRCRYMDMLDD